jgi:hypothetical protein
MGRCRQEAVAGAEGEGNAADERSGLFTSGVVALREGRRIALFYKTVNGARVGDLFMSLIYTCELNEATRSTT